MKPIYKILITLVVIIIVIFLSYFLWTKFFAPKSVTPQEPGTGVIITPPSDNNGQTGGGDNPPGGAPGTSTPTTSNVDEYLFKKLSDKPALAFWVSVTGNTAFYVSESGVVMEAKDGEDSVVSKQPISNFISLEASPSGEKVILSFGSPSNIQLAIFDSVDKVLRPLPKEILNASWAGTDNQLVGVTQQNDVTLLSLINISKQPYTYKTLVTNFSIKDALFSTKSATEILISEKPSSHSLSGVWQLDTDTGVMTLVVSPALGSFIRWASGKDLMFKFASPNKFSILDRSFGEISPVLFTTLPNKCDGGLDVIYCFIPKDKGVFSNTNSMPDDYFMNNIFTSDDFYKISPSSGIESLIMAGGSGKIPVIDADNVSYANSSTYFINKYDNYVYAIQKTTNEVINDY
ncbi:MAG: hypothetical protein NTZ36_00625 [Candidatus Jorgensenbacteria bacterium]|nr:hypothetical protein [Candidatus Jorgensenbacteria bacterium]